MSSENWQPVCLGLNVLDNILLINYGHDCVLFWWLYTSFCCIHKTDAMHRKKSAFVNIFEQDLN